MPRWIHRASALVLVAISAACGESGPTGNPPPPPPPPPDPQVAAIESQINGLFAAADAANALAQFRSVDTDVRAGRVPQAESKMITLIEFTLDRHEAGQLTDPNGGAPPTTEEALADFTNDLFDFVGSESPDVEAATFEDGGAADVVGPSGGTVVTGNDQAGVDVPAGAFSAATLVTITRVPEPGVKGTGPLPTSQPQYPQFYDFTASSAPSVQVSFGVCVLEDPPEPLGAPSGIFGQLRLAQPDPQDPQTVAVLSQTAAGFLDCSGATALSRVSPGRALSANTASAAETGPLLGRGLGGLATSFSVVGAIVPLQPPSSDRIHVMSETSCALRGTGELWCWGDNFSGTFGDGTMNDSQTPTRGAGGMLFRHIDMAVPNEGEHVCGIDAAGDAYCWGDNLEGQLGDGTRTDRLSPVPVNTSLKFIDIDGGDTHTCAIAVGGQGYCWGRNNIGQLGDGTVVDKITPAPIAGNLTLVELDVGEDHACALDTSGQAHCWGDGSALGNGSFADVTVPTPVSGGRSFTQVTTGDGHTCAIDVSGAPYCWGSDNEGSLGNGTPDVNRAVPTAVSTSMTFTAISAGERHTCGVSVGGAGFCWGEGENGQIGNGGTTSLSVPTMISSGLTFVFVAAGEQHSCGLTTSNEYYCWGDNSDGMVGDGVPTSGGGHIALTPVRVSVP